jgi:hypothetical protein
VQEQNLPDNATRWRFEALALWHLERFGQKLPYVLLEKQGEFVLADNQGNPVAPIKDPFELHERIIILCKACGVASPCSQFCIECGRHQENCCQCRLTGLKDTREVPRLPRS